MTVRFVHTEVEVLPGLVVYIDGNSKITASAGTFDDPRPNAFSLPHVSCCPGATPTCIAGCYVHKLTRKQAELAEMYKRNERALHSVLMTKYRTELSARALGTWIADECAEFRWHVSGDVISQRHAHWLISVCAWSRRTQHWIYTRTHTDDVLGTLTLAPNLALNMSIDADNDTPEARRLARKYGARLCYMTGDGTLPMMPLPRDSVIFPDQPVRVGTEAGREWWDGLALEQKKQVCPSDYFDHSNAHRCGPCRKCMRPVRA